MLKHIVTAVIACVGIATGFVTYAATSIPMPEAGFALASNGGNGVDTITAPASVDVGGGLRSAERRDPGPETTAETVSHDAVPADTTATHTDHVHPAASDGAPVAATSGAHKARGNAHWQSLLPGLMK